MIADEIFNGNITSMAKRTFISRTTINSIIGEKEVAPGFEIIKRIAEMSSPKINLKWLILGVGDMLEEDISQDKSISAAQNNTNSNIGNQVNNGAVIIRLLAQLEEKDRQIAARDGQITNLIELLKK